MPGILPMKVIKVGSSAQSRIAQACDRCRSKKIRCDGIRPCCSQCANVGFECKTSDKLSRRAFPRGYTESLEERVRSLEGEVRELKDLLDEKDEKIDILSKMHSNSKLSTTSSPIRESSKNSKEEMFRVQASPLLFDSENSDSYFMGASSGRAFVDAFKRKIQESGKSCADFNTDGFLNVHNDSPKHTTTPIPNPSLAPPRLFTDRMVNVFFQEWAPLFPVLHKPSFLQLYEKYVENPGQTTDQQELAQLYLVFGISAISDEVHELEQLSLCEVRWRMALDELMMDNTLVTLQCLILAQLFCIAKGDHKCLQHYKAIAVGLSHRLGLHQSQKRFGFGALTIEMRKRVFWSLYTVDSFSAASLGLPKLLTEADVYTEYPNDIDDEYVTEKGFQPTLPGEYTKVSSALALFRISRILSKVLEKNYPAAASHDLSLASIGALEQELNNWSSNLPSHLKLTFIQNKPSAEVTGNRSPILSLTFYYIKTLIHRPVIGACLSTKSSSSLISLAESSKHIIQITRLLKDRHLAFSLCLNKDELMTLCGLSLLYQRLELKQDGKLMRDGGELVQEVVKSLAKSNASGASEFTKLAMSMGIEHPLHSRAEPRTGIAEPQNPTLTPSPAAAKMHQASNHGGLASAVTHTQHQRRATISTISLSQVHHASPSDLSEHPLEDDYSENPESGIGRHRLHQSLSPQLSRSPKPASKSNRSRTKRPNLDFLSLSGSNSRSHSTSPIQSRRSLPNHNKEQDNAANFRSSAASNPDSPPQPQKHRSSTSSSGWETILGSVDESQIYDAMYGGTSLPLSLTSGFSIGQEEKYAGSTASEWSPSADGWDVARLNMHHFSRGTDNAPGSVLSFSEESLSSGEEFGDVNGGPANGIAVRGDRMDYEQLMLTGNVDDFHLDEDLSRW